ncbi:MAG: 3-dehydroquinate synthase [Candidatus Marinimicrobia bacterium]|nr:3-dehydroquinate synthase [Candidatus Neomarinimicrobiota bacterium]
MHEQFQIDVKPQLKTSDYSIFLGENILVKLEEFIFNNFRDHQLVVITDENVFQYQWSNLTRYVSEDKIFLIVNKAGEESKAREVKNRIDDELLGRHFSRKTLMIGFGGGVVGDLSGYVAATYKRGIPVVQVPSSLLAMVDSSVGGKTGINTPVGKNLIGAFWQPAAVFADIKMLETLPQEEYLNGLAECVKTALIMDRTLFELMESNPQAIVQRDPEILIQIIKRCVELKREVVNLDTHEGGIRQILNFGHTIGHAMETLSQYSIKHGFGVSIGMAAEMKMSQLTGNFTEKELARIIDFFKKLKLPCAIPKEFSFNEISTAMLSDKKAEKGIVMYVLLDQIGKYREVDGKFSFSVGDEIVRESIEFCKKLE